MKYLSLLDMTSSLDEERTLLIQPLAKAYNEIKLASAERIREYENRLKVEPEEEWEMGMTNHTFIEGQIEDISYEFHLQRDAVATALILVAQSYLHSKFQNVLSAYDYFRNRKGFTEQFKAIELRESYFSLGDKVSGTSVSWAEAVKAGSNYARHFEEWNVSPTKMKKLPTGELVFEKVKNLILELKDTQRGTAQTLLNIGFPEDELFDKRNNLSQRIVELLKLDDPDNFSCKTSVWLDEVMKELHRKFDSFDK